MPLTSEPPEQLPTRQRVPRFADAPMVDYDRLFRQPLLPPDAIYEESGNQGFFSRYRDVVWWIVLFGAISVFGVIALHFNAYSPLVVQGCS